jgi:hypothetical protein
MGAYAKAIVGSILAALTALQVALNPIGEAAPSVTATEWVGVGLAAIVTFGGVFGVSNSPSS